MKNMKKYDYQKYRSGVGRLGKPRLAARSPWSRWKPYKNAYLSTDDPLSNSFVFQHRNEHFTMLNIKNEAWPSCVFLGRKQWIKHHAFLETTTFSLKRFSHYCSLFWCMIKFRRLNFTFAHTTAMQLLSLIFLVFFQNKYLWL